MKIFVLFALLVASVAANLDTSVRDDRPPTGDVIPGLYFYFNRWSQTIQNAGLDPWNVERSDNRWSILTPDLFSVHTFVRNFNSNGLSRYVVNTLRFPFLSSNLQVDVEMPRIVFSFGSIGTGLRMFGVDINVEGSGTVVLSRFRLHGEVRFRNRVFNENYVRSVDLGVNLGQIESNLRVTAGDVDISATVNEFITQTLHETLSSYKGEIDNFVRRELLPIIEEVM